ITPDLGQQICQRDGIKALLHPSIASLGSQYVITLQALNAANGDTLAEAQATANSENTILAALDKAGTQLRRKLGESLASIRQFDQPLEEATTSSLPALQALTLADNYMSAGDYPAAIRSAQRAVALDPNFAMAYRTLAFGLGDNGDAAAGLQAAEKGFALRNRTSERERMQIAGAYYDLSGQLPKAVRIYQSDTQVYPRDAIAWNDLAVAYGFLGEFHRQLAAALTALRLEPAESEPYENAAGSYAELNQLDAANAILQSALAHHFNIGVIHGMLWEIAWAQGNAAAQARQAALLGATPASRMHLLEFQAGVAALHGQLTQARRLDAQVLPLAQQLGLETATANDCAALEGLAEAGYGERATALKSAATLVASGRPNAEALAAGIYAQTGDAAAAVKALAAATKQLPDSMYMRYITPAMVAAEAAIRRHDGAAAVAAMAPAAAYDGNVAAALYEQGAAELAAGHAAAAAAAFGRVLALKAVALNWTSPAPYSLSQLDLARAYTLEHDIPQARTAYQNFFALLQHADPGLPVLAQARAEYARLH
ncbi:MAG: hypothetical protein ACRD1Y_03485, partial [Terriglobales bacterium]